MNKQQLSRKKKVTKKPEDSKPSQTDKPLSQFKAGNPMNKFNNALRKILSVPKKNVKDR